MLGALAEAGAIVCEDPAQAEIILVNTCGFIESAKQESIDAILDLAEWKQRGACRKLVVVGCLAQRYGEELRQGMPEIDALHGLGDLRGILRSCGLRTPKSVRQGCVPRLRLTPDHFAYLRISEGCDNRCSYCAIPLIRGPFRSRRPERILAEAEALVDLGARELNVIGQDTSAYGKDLPDGPALPELLRRLSRIPKLRWVRVLYMHPAHVTEELVEEIARNGRIVPYVDLPVQHLNDEILKRMGRKISQADILRLIGKVRGRIHNAVIRTTLMVGFPGETEAAFEEMLRLVRRIKFERLGAFTYSPEEGTPAARFRKQVPQEVKEERFARVMAAQQRIAFRRNRERVGRELDLLVDGPLEDAGEWVARSYAEAPEVDPIILLSGKHVRRGRFHRGRITGTDGYDLIAQAIPRHRTGAQRSR